MSNKPDIFSLAHYSLNLAEKEDSNLKCADIYFGKSKYINIEIEENSIKNSEIGSDYGVSIRVINKKGSLGFAFTNKLEKSSLSQIVKLSTQMMNAGTSDPDFKNLPEKYDKYPDVKDLFHKDTKDLDIEDSLSYVEDLIKVCKEDDLAISQTANFLSSYSKSFIFNSNGIETQGKETFCVISSNLIVKDKVSNETAFGYDWQSERKIGDLNATEIANNALEEAKRNLNRIKIKSMKVPLILTPGGTISFILSPISSAINAETFQYKRSFLVGKRGETIGSELLNIEDNALINGAIGSRPFDGEGSPCKNKIIINEGKFLKSGLLHNSYTAGKEGVESTGNASRASYSSIPRIGTTNFIMQPGDISKDEMIKELKEGIILDSTGDSPNIVTGDFSGLIMHGNLIKNGEIKEPLNETMFGINLLDLFKQIDAVSKDFKIYGGMYAPYIKIKEINIIGSAS
jgi:PmbA protein